MKISIIGGGNMGSALIKGVVASKFIAPENISLSGPHQATLDKVAEVCPGIATSTDNSACIKGADVIVLAVKPWILPGVLEEIAPMVAFREQIIVSLASGITIDDMANILSRYSSARILFRVIPNTAMTVRKSMTFISHNNATEKQVEKVQAIFDQVGETAVIDERFLPAATALCSCGIAYAMRYVRAATEGGVELGIYPNKAKDYILATLEGAVELLRATGANPEAEIDKVTTPGGITIKGLNAMEANGFSHAVIEGIKASTSR